MIECKHITTISFKFGEGIILNCSTLEELKEKIKNNEIITIKYNKKEIIYINASYIVSFEITNYLDKYGNPIG